MTSLHRYDKHAATVSLALGLILFLPMGSHAEQLLGRLFATPQERAALEQLRYAPPPAPVQQPKPVEVKKLPRKVVKKPIVLPTVTLNGVVYRSDGNNTAWVNGASTQDGALVTQQIHVDPRNIRRGDATVRLAKGAKIVRLRPGETYAPGLKKVIQNYQQPFTKPDAAGR
jgi:hypothetical protein